VQDLWVRVDLSGRLAHGGQGGQIQREGTNVRRGHLPLDRVLREFQSSTHSGFSIDIARIGCTS
jgi:hypothetical protein